MRQILGSISRKLFKPRETLNGYEAPELVDIVFRKTLAYLPQRDWPEMHGVSTVLDFGGGCGLHYKQARSPTVRWAVVETVAMVARAKELSTDRLQFFTSITEAADWLGPIEIMHSDGALQYTPDPTKTLRELCGLQARRMIWQRLLFGSDRGLQSSFLSDNGPGRSPPLTEKMVVCERAAIPEHLFVAAHDAYELTNRGPDWFRYSLR